jgi:hypothetical protein
MMTITQGTVPGADDQLSVAGQPFLNHVAEQLTSGAVHEAMQNLFLWLRCQKITHPKGQWSALASDCLKHPIATLLHQDPLTWRTFQKPKGYAGDATMLDFIYSMEDDSFLPSFANPITATIFRFTASAPAGRAVCARRRIIAGLIDQVAEQIAYPRILSIAAGHLREAALSQAVREGRIKELIALDQDEESLATIKRAYGMYPVETRQGSVKSLLSPKLALGRFDLVYASGLFDYLSQRLAQRLTRTMFDLLHPGGQMLVTNFVPLIPDIGYMESFMDWHLIYRTHEEMQDLAALIPAEAIGNLKLFTESDQNLLFLQITKKA